MAHNVSEKAPHFFKFLLHDSIRQGTLMIPRSFTTKHGEDLTSDTVLIRVPSGAEWQVKLSKAHTPNGVWTLHGLHKFMEFYSLQLGHFLLFRYLGKSSFWVIICDTSASEIQYPVHDSDPCAQEDAEEGEGFMKPEISRTPKPLIASQKSRALTMATSFKSKNPFFVVSMQPSYICNKFRLNIPLSFITKYFLKDCGYLNLHCSNCGPWRVKFIRYNSKEGNNPKVEFAEGWKEFAQDNTLGVGDACVFELKKGGESSFEVVIYRSREEADSHDLKRMKAPKMGDTGDDADDAVSVQAVDGFTPGGKALGKTPLTCLQPQKMSTVRLGTHTEGVKLEKPKRKRGPSFQQDLEDEGHMATGKRRLVSGIPKRRTALSCSETDRAFQMAKSLVQPESPFFMISMSPSHVIRGVRLHIPRAFVLEHFPNKDLGDIILWDSKGTTWSVKYGSRTSNSTSRVEFTHGWKEFMQNHDLEVGDACVFEMINTTKFSLKVTILRVNQYADANHFERRKGIEIEESEDDDFTEILGGFSPCKTGEKIYSSMYGSRDTEEGGGLMASGQTWPNHDISGTLNPLSGVASKKSRALQMATCFQTQNPFFVVLMQPSHVSDRFRLCIPTSFVTKYGLQDHGYLNLHGSNGGPWQVKCVRYSDHRVNFTDGWKEFAQDNKLVAGDVCVFELNKSSESSLEVVIYRSHDDAHSHDYTCDDDDVQVLDGKTPLTCPRPEKMNTVRLGTQSNGVKPKRKLGSNFQQDLEEGTNPRRTTALSCSEKTRALQMTISLVKPESPFFVIVMQPSYVIHGLRLQIPRDFVHKHFSNKDHGDIILWDSLGRAWPVKYSSRTASHCGPKIEFTHGWKEFMQEYDLVIGDTCVFELVDITECLFEVTVLRVNQYADGNHFERKKVIKTKESKDGKVLDGKKGEKKTSTSSMRGSRDNLTHQDRIGEQRSEYPCFHRTMCWEYLHNGLSVPRSFARKYIKKTSCPVHLQVADKSWVLQSQIYRDGSGKFSRFSSFVRENSLREGDVCIFELIKSKLMLFKVSIVRYTA